MTQVNLVFMKTNVDSTLGTTLETRVVAEPVISGSDGLLQSLKTPKAVSN